MEHNSIPELVEDIQAGRMIVMIDDEERENEGDLVMAASKVRPEDINFMARYGRGLICMPLTRERCSQLNLPLMVNKNDARFATNFTVSIEAAEGITTGISAYDRAHTIRTAVRPDASDAFVSQPGHVFPLMAQPGGVLTRAGHTEASVDLAMIAGLEPAAVLVDVAGECSRGVRSVSKRTTGHFWCVDHGCRSGTGACTGAGNKGITCTPNPVRISHGNPGGDTLCSNGHRKICCKTCIVLVDHQPVVSNAPWSVACK